MVRHVLQWGAMRRPLFLLIVAFAAACGSSPDAVPTKEVSSTCASRAALVFNGYVGTSLAPKRLALTFDDGPGNRTEELSQYLAAEGIKAAFFVNGVHLPKHPDALARLAADGHLVGNHTQDHPDLAKIPVGPVGDATIVKQLTDTDVLIAPFVQNAHFLFRAPYGAYDGRSFVVLQRSPMKKYVGHVGWDIGEARTDASAADWACWQNAPKLTTKACGDLYMMEIEKVGRGIVLMHDQDYGNSNNVNVNAGVGNTVDMVKYLVPKLKAKGYTFVRVDETPVIDKVFNPPPPPKTEEPKPPPPPKKEESPAPPAAPTPGDDPCATSTASFSHDHAH